VNYSEVSGAKILYYIDSKRNEIIEFLRKLVRIPSTVGKELRAQEFMYKKFKSMNLKVDIWEPDDNELRKRLAFSGTASFTKYGYKNVSNVIAKLKGEGRIPCRVAL